MIFLFHVGCGFAIHVNNTERRRSIYSGTFSGIFTFSFETTLGLTVRYRALGIDNRVARLTYVIDQRREWPEPYLLSKLIRHITYPIKKCWLVTKKALSDVICTVRVYICETFHTGRTGDDVEMGESARREEAEAHEETCSPDKKAKNEFRKSLQKFFSEADLVMSNIEYWEDEM